MDFEAFLGVSQIEQCKDFQFGNQLRGIRHRYSRLFIVVRPGRLAGGLWNRRVLSALVGSG
ncbi:dTDP-4-amino-4,6-dideoxygalactose transaminase [Pseudomonas syringae pv. actinidiae]|uniref:dTDP-4-amino-4,6-dideoxygalactose transaminase n=1 Tax=Pseudomonas syringae pv. actinidiae TaxID=103796 RepID=A0A2V0Q8X3_PSESF|nr:dTDP-4-amino-4,6-dideoxygalactose transaminase [Pseudomonas syringae pv. actinidiae]